VHSARFAAPDDLRAGPEPARSRAVDVAGASAQAGDAEPTENATVCLIDHVLSPAC
jgi:hypothetical protein